MARMTINERTSGLYTATLTDPAGAVIQGSLLEALTLTLYDEATGTVINGRDAQSVLGVNGGAVSDAGVLTWTVAPADNAVVTAGVGHEKHVALFHAVWYNGAREAYHDAEIYVKRMNRVPAA